MSGALARICVSLLRRTRVREPQQPPLDGQMAQRQLGGLMDIRLIVDDQDMPRLGAQCSILNVILDEAEEIVIREGRVAHGSSVFSMHARRLGEALSVANTKL